MARRGAPGADGRHAGRDPAHAGRRRPRRDVLEAPASRRRSGIAVVDIWRFEDGQIAEGWEIIEPVAQAPANFEWWKSADR
ncbi:hypothetical protein [Nannocystis pusilla]|uniref:hypothetical protein n=1 Tax=Nannocystis pusilla TaxID=889268 RepID=UPI003B792A6D